MNLQKIYLVGVLLCMNARNTVERKAVVDGSLEV